MPLCSTPKCLCKRTHWIELFIPFQGFFLCATLRFAYLVAAVAFVYVGFDVSFLPVSFGPTDWTHLIDTSKIFVLRKIPMWLQQPSFCDELYLDLNFSISLKDSITQQGSPPKHIKSSQASAVPPQHMVGLKPFKEEVAFRVSEVIW